MLRSAGACLGLLRCAEVYKSLLGSVEVFPKSAGVCCDLFSSAGGCRGPMGSAVIC